MEQSQAVVAHIKLCIVCSKEHTPQSPELFTDRREACHTTGG